MNQERCWVHSSFKKKLKKEAAEKGMSILQLTEELGTTDEFLKKFKDDKKKERFRFKI